MVEQLTFNQSVVGSNPTIPTILFRRIEMIERAKEFAKLKHQGQMDDTGKDYFESHLTQVVNILVSVTTDPEIIAAGYLHDILEDTTVTTTELEQLFGHRITTLVWEVTHVGQKDSVGYSFPNLHSTSAIMIKFADRLSNISRMENWTDGRKEQYLRKSKFWRA